MIFYAIRTAPQREKALAGWFNTKGEWIKGILQRTGYDVFCPFESKTRRSRGRNGKRFTVSYPMFNGYIFVGGDFSWAELLEENHVIGFVKMYPSGMAAPVVPSEMARLRSIDGAAIPWRKAVNPHKALRAGENAIIKHGQWAGQEIRIEGLNGQTADAMLQLFGGDVRVKIRLDALEAA